MSTMPGLASKAEKGKSKFQSLDINNLYRHSLGENLERSAQKSAAPLKHGMQSLGKVPSARRPPANLPSVKAEQNNTSSAPITVTSESQLTASSSAVVPPGSAGVQQEQSQSVQQSWVGKQQPGNGDVVAHKIAVVGAGGIGLPTATPAITQQSQHQPQLSAHQAAIALPVTNMILPSHNQQSQQQSAQQVPQGPIGVYHLTAAQQAQLQHLHMQTAAAAAAAAQAQAQKQGGTVQNQGQGGVGGVDKSWSAVMSSVDADGNMVALGAMALGGTVGGGAAGSHHHHHHHHPLHHHGLQGVQQPPPYHSVQFQHEFPSLSATTDNNSSGAAGGIGGGTGNVRAGNQGGVCAQQPQHPQQSLPIGGPDVQYGPGPSLRPQTEGSWMQGGGAQVRSSSQQPQQSGTPGGGNVTVVAAQASQPVQPNATATVAQQIPAHFRGIVPPFMYRGGNFPPMNGHHAPMSSQQQHSMPAQHHHPSIQHAEGRQGHPGPPRRGGLTEQQAEVITHRPIIREEELSRMDEMVRDMGWAAHEDIDYNQQLAFSDDDDSVIDAGVDAELRSGGSKLQTGTALGQRTKIHGGSRHDIRSERSDHLRSGSHPNHQSASQSLQQQHKESLYHHHQSHHQQDASNYPSSYSSRQQQMPQVSTASISGPNNQSGGSIGGYAGGGQTISSAALSQQKSWSSSGSSSAGTGGNRGGGTVITRRSNECDDEIAERRRQQNQAVSTAIERAKQRKEEEEKRYLESKQAANKKLQELDERSKNKREQRELDESTGTITQASVPPQPIMHSTIPVPEWEREKDNRDNRERNLRENSEEKSLKSSISDENATTTSSSTSNFHQLTQIESSRTTTYRKDNVPSIRGGGSVGIGNTIVDIGVPPPFSRQFQTNLPPRFQKQKQQATGGGAGGPSSLGSLSAQYDQGRYGGGKGNSPPRQQQDRGDRQQLQGQRGLKEDKDIGPRERDSDRDSRDMRMDRDRDRDDHNIRGYGGRGKQSHQTASNMQPATSNLPASDDSVTYRQNRYSSSNSNRYTDDYSRDYDYNPNNTSGNNGGNSIRSVGKNNSLTNSSSVGKELDRRGYEKQDSAEIDNMRGSRHSSSDEWGSARDRYDRERPQRPDSRDSRASRDSRHSVESTPRLSESRDFASWSESPYEPPYEAEQHKQHKHQQSQSRHLAVPGPITKERLEQSSDDLKSPSNLDKHLHNVGGGQAHNHGGQQQHHQQQPQRSGGLTQLKRGGAADKKNDDAWTIRRGRSSSKEESGGTDIGGTGSAASTAWADSIPDDKQIGKQVSDHHENKKDYDDLKGRRNDNRNTNSKGSNWNDSGREQAPYSRNNSWTSSKKSSSSTSSIGGGGGGSRSDLSERLPQGGRNQRPPSVKSGESEGSADEVSVTIDNSAKDEVTKHIKKIEKDEKNKEILRAILPESVKKTQQPTISENKSKDGIGGGGSGSGCNTAYIPRGEPSRHGRGGGNSSASFRGGRGNTSGGSVKRMDYYGLPAASKSPFGNNQDDKDKKVCDDSTVSSHITDEDKAKVQQKKEQTPNEHDKERYGKSKRTDNRRNKPRGPKDDNELASDNSEDGKGGGKRLGNHQKSMNRGGCVGGNASSSGGGGRKPLNSGAIGGQIGNQQQSRQQSHSDKRFGNSYGNSGRQNSSGNLRNSNRKDENITKEEDEDDLPRTEDGFQEVRNKKTLSTKKPEDTKSVNAMAIGNTSSVVGSAKVPVVSGSGAIVVASVSATVAVASAPGGKVEKDCLKGGISGGGKAKAGAPGLSQQQIANIPSLMSVPVNPPMMKGQYDRGRQNKLPPRFAKQRENRLNSQHQQHFSHMDHSPANSTSSGDLNKTANVTTSPSTYVLDGSGIGVGTAATSSAGGATASVGNAWDKPLSGQLRNSGLESDVSGLLSAGLDGKADSLEKLKSSDKTSVLLDSCAAPVNTIIFENSNYKSTSSPAGTAVRVPITTNRNTGPPITSSGGSSSVSSIIGSSAQPRSIQQQMEDQAAAAAEAAVLGALIGGKSDSLAGKSVSQGDVDMMFSKEDDAGMKMDFFETEISHLTDDKATTKNIGLARSIQQTMVGSTGGSISASTADALNIKIQSVKKVWENANDHPVVIQDDGSGFVAGFGPDHNSLDPSGAFSKGADTPDDLHEGYSPSPNQAVSSANTNVCKVKPNQQAAAAAAVAAAQAAAHSGNIVSVAQQHQQQQVHVQQAQQHQQVAHAQAAAVAAAQAAVAQAAAAQVVQMSHHGSTMVGHQVLGHPLSPPPPLPGATVLGAATCQPTGGGGAFGTGQHLGYQSMGGTTNYNLSAIPSPPTVLHQFGSSQSQLQAAAVAAAAQAAAAQAQAVQQNSLYGNFPQLDPQSHQVATARAPQYAPAQYGSPYGLGGSASSPYSTSVPPPPQSLYMTGPPGGPPPHGPPQGPPGSGTGAQSVQPSPDHLYQNMNNYRLAAAAAAAAAGGSPFGNQQNNPATVLISSSNNNSLMSASVVGKSGVGGGGGAGSGAGSGSTGQISAIGTKAGGVGPAYSSHSHSQQAAQQLAYMTYDLSMSGYHLPPPPPQQRGQQGGGPPPGPPPPQGSSQVQQNSSSYYNQNTGGQTGYFQQQQPQSSGVNASGQQGPQLGNGGGGGGLASQHAAAAAAYGLQAVATAAALFGNQSHQPISNATTLQNYGSHYLSNSMLAAINVQQQQQQQQQQQYRSQQQQYMKSSNQQQLMDQQAGSGGRQQLKSPGSQQDGLSSVFNSGPQIPSPKARQQNCKMQVQQQQQQVQTQQQQQLPQMSQPSPVTNVQHNKYNLYNVPPAVTNQPPPGQVRYPAPIQRPVNFQANLGSAQNIVSGNNLKHRPNNPNNRPSTGARQYYGQALNHNVNDVVKSDENAISKLSEQMVSSGGAANGTNATTVNQKTAGVVASNVASNTATPTSSGDINSSKDANNMNQQPQTTNKDETSATAGIKD